LLPYAVISSIILAAAIDDKDIYSNINILYAVFNIVIAGVAGTYVWYNIYLGLADAELSGLFWAKICMVIIVLLAVIQALGDFGNVNGLANLGADRLSEARDVGKGIGSFWTAMSVIESLGWVAVVVMGSYTSYLVWTH